MSTTVKKIHHMMRANDENLSNELDKLKGSYAVEYVLESLLRQSDEDIDETIDSVLELIRKKR